MIDDAVVRRRLRRLDELLQGLREIGARSREEFIGDSTSQYAAAWCLQRAIQAVLDIGAHILAERGLVDWEEYREIPTRLARDCGLPAELAARLEKAAGLRNILVHMYVEVDPELIYKTLQEELGAFNEFAEYVLRVLRVERLKTPGTVSHPGIRRPLSNRLDKLARRNYPDTTKRENAVLPAEFCEICLVARDNEVDSAKERCLEYDAQNRFSHLLASAWSLPNEALPLP